MKKKNAFTLIELIAVLVILAVIALIVTPLVLNIVKKAKESANKRSVDAYGKAVELAVATYLLDTGDYPTSLDKLTVEYSGNEVVCNVKTLNEDGSIYLSECTVKGTEVKDSKTEDGWYHYGKLPTIAYDLYNIGDTVTYNGIRFYVIENSDEASDSVTLLKAEPLTVDEVNEYGTGHVNMYVTSDTDRLGYQKACGDNYGGVAYYSSATCGETANGEYSSIGCTTDYNQSEIKYVVDAWSDAMLKSSDLKKDSLGYKTRLLTIEELITNLGYIPYDTGSSREYIESVDTPSWIYDNNYSYWTMSSSDDSMYIWSVNRKNIRGDLVNNYWTMCYGEAGRVRPVVTLLKSAI